MKSPPFRLAQYEQLVEARRSCRACTGLANPSVICDGKFDSAAIGPWSLWQGNLSARVMVVGQDWGGVDSFIKNEGFEDPVSPTNDRLIELLGIAGIQIEPPAKFGAAGQIFMTNAILCMKVGNLQASVERAWFENCGSRFLRPLVELVAPKAVVGLGVDATLAVCSAFGVGCPRPFKSAVEAEEGIPLPNGSTLFPRYHCGARSTNINRKKADQDEDWRRFGLWLSRRPP